MIDKYSGTHWDGGVSLEICKARHRAVLSNKCGCGKLRDPSEVHRIGSRTWTSCLRCLGTIKQYS